MDENHNQADDVDEPLCIQWKRAAQAAFYEKTRGMSEEELLAYFEQLNQAARARRETPAQTVKPLDELVPAR